MAESVATGRGGTSHKQNEHGRTPAQWYCYIAGAALLLAGIFGFFADSTFDTGVTSDPEGGNIGGALQGDSFLGFEVNGWHNVVHLLSGLFLLSMAGKRRTAKPAALAFGVVYGIVAIIGLIDGNDVLGLFPINAADNILHIALSLLGIAAALLSDKHDRDHHTGTGTGRARAHEVDTPAVRGGTGAATGAGRTIRPEDHDRTGGRG